MTEQKFWGLAGIGDNEEFDYGRDVIRDGEYDRMLILPYREMPLFLKAEWFQTYSANDLVSVSGILRSGLLSGASIKAEVTMKKIETNDDSLDDKDKIDPKEDENNEDEENQQDFELDDFEEIDQEDFDAIRTIDIKTGDKNAKLKLLMDSVNVAVPFDLSKNCFMKQLYN